MSAVDKRLYYLMLSPASGQNFAEQAGFSPPSEEVQEAETYDVISRWAIMTTAGIMEDIIETAEWFLDLSPMIELDEDSKHEFQKTLIAHGVGLVNKLLDSQKVIIVAEFDILGEEDDDE